MSMTIESKLIELLATGETHSGTDLGAELGVSRVAIKKRISALINQGMPVEAIQGKGYRLRPGADLLSDSQIKKSLTASVAERIEEIEIHQTLASTNAYLKSLPAPQSGMARVVLAEAQPEGKGRRGRNWVTTPYRNLMLSIAWRYRQWPRNPAAMSLAFGVAVHQALVDSGVTDVQIKWPNDILLGGKKLAGLLVDAGGEASGACDFVFGVGINFYLEPETGKRIDQEWGHLFSIDPAGMSRNQMAASIVSNLVEALILYESEGFAPFMPYWNENAAYVNHPVRLFNESDELSGVLKGVDDAGVLVLDGFDGKEHRFTQSDISLRPLESEEPVKIDNSSDT